MDLDLAITRPHSPAKKIEWGRGYWYEQNNGEKIFLFLIKISKYTSNLNSFIKSIKISRLQFLFLIEIIYIERSD